MCFHIFDLDVIFVYCHGVKSSKLLCIPDSKLRSGSGMAGLLYTPMATLRSTVNKVKQRLALEETHKYLEN